MNSIDIEVFNPGSGGSSYTDEEAQDAIGSILVDSSSIDFTYDDGTPSITAVVLPGGVDHDQLLNFVSDEHVAHSGITIIAGTHLTGGGTIDGNVTLNVDTSGLNAALDHGALLGKGDDDHTQYMQNATGAVTDNRIARWDGTTQRLIQTSGISIDDSAKLVWATSSSTIWEDSGDLVIQQSGGTYFGTGSDSALYGVGMGFLGIGDLIPSAKRLLVQDATTTRTELADFFYTPTTGAGGSSSTPARNTRMVHRYIGVDEEIFQTGLLIEVENYSANGSETGPDTTSFEQYGLRVRTGLDGASLALDTTGGTGFLASIEIDPTYFGVGQPTHSGGEMNIIGLYQKTITNNSSIAWRRLGSLWSNVVGLKTRVAISFDADVDDLGDTQIVQNSSQELQFDSQGVNVLNLADDEVRIEVAHRTIIGDSTSYTRIGGIFDSNVTSVGSVTTGNQVAHSRTIPANSLSANGDVIRGVFTGTVAANGNSKRFVIQVDSSSFIDTGAITQNGGSWRVVFETFRIDSSNVLTTGVLTRIAGSGAVFTTPFRASKAITFSSSFAIRAVMSTATANNDLTVDTSAIWINNAN